MRAAVAIHPVGMMWYYRPVLKRSGIKPGKIFGWLGSLALHATLLFLGGAVLIKPIEFSVDHGLSGMEVQLVTGVEEPVKDSVEPEPVKIMQPVLEKTSQPQPVVEKMEILEQVPPEAVKEVIAVQPVVQPLTVDEKKIEKVVTSKPIAKPVVKGNSPVNVSSTGQGAKTKAKPDYLSNPAPRYPLEARRNGWEGTVLIRAYVDKAGYPQTVEIEKSSGHSTLDQSALKTVRTWRFSPARVGQMPVESMVHLPVRFDLDDI